MRDSFTCYASLEANISKVARDGFESFLEEQSLRGSLLDEMLDRFDEGRSKSYYCIAATLLDPSELRAAIDKASDSYGTCDVRERAKALHTLLDEAACRRSLRLALRR
ncbi:MAG: hypothetical protein QUS11_00800 [Candidatus Fermentibacter sp.]|nr:hypothetical protein [Candidatus Fermentibacter sp.]